MKTVVSVVVGLMVFYIDFAGYDYNNTIYSKWGLQYQSIVAFSIVNLDQDLEFY